jgi:putative transposase
MRDILTLFLHAIVIIIRLGRPGGLRSVVAESVLMRHQILILNRGRKRARNLRPTDRIIAGLCTLLMRPARVLWSAVALKPSTLMHFHKMLTKQKYRLLFSSTLVRRSGPKGPMKELIDAVIEMKRRNPTWGCKRIAQPIALAFGVDIDKDVVRRILGIHFRPEAGSGGPSWLSLIGHAKDSLLSLDLFRCDPQYYEPPRIPLFRCWPGNRSPAATTSLMTSTRRLAAGILVENTYHQAMPV